MAAAAVQQTAATLCESPENGIDDVFALKEKEELLYEEADELFLAAERKRTLEVVKAQFFSLLNNMDKQA